MISRPLEVLFQLYLGPFQMLYFFQLFHKDLLGQLSKHTAMLKPDGQSD